MDTPIIPQTVTIKLTQGLTTIVDLIDSDLALIKWQARHGYAVHSWRKNKVYGKDQLHCVIYERMTGRKLIKGDMVDHIDTNPLNNCRDNLRLADHTKNCQNANRRKDNQSGYKGVSIDGHKWRARIQANGKSLFLGNYDTPELAHVAYCEAAKKYHGEFARVE